MTGEIDDLQLQVDSSNQLAISLEKKSRNFDKIVSEWKAKVEDLTQQLEEAQKEKRYNTVPLGDWLEKKVSAMIIKQQFGFPMSTT